MIKEFIKTGLQQFILVEQFNELRNPGETPRHVSHFIDIALCKLLQVIEVCPSL